MQQIVNFTLVPVRGTINTRGGKKQVCVCARVRESGRERESGWVYESILN